jgi:hypothetical protein
VNSHQPVNPYIAGNPITGTEMFYGRADVFSFVRRNLIGLHRDTPVVLYGQRRTGKTSVLYQLQRHLDPRYRCIFMDLHGLNLDGLGNFLLGMANYISEGLQRDHRLVVEVPDRATFLADPKSEFETIFLAEALSVVGEDHLVLMLDELIRLEEEIQSGHMEREVFDYLRHLMQHHARLNFIFSLGSGLEEMEKEYAFLFNTSLYHRISFLEPAAARDLITQPAQDYYEVAPEAIEKILQITSCHPYYTQLVCHCLFDLWSRSPKPVMSVADVDAVLAEAIELGSANLTYVWRDSTPGEQATMAGMAAAMRSQPGPVTVDQVRRVWRTTDVSLPAREAVRAVRGLVAREVIAGADTYSFAVDLQRLWLDKHRRLDWVKDELTDSVLEWNRSAEPWPADAISGQPDRPTTDRAAVSGPAASKGTRPSAGRRYLAIAAAAVIVVGYLTAALVAGLPPFQGPAPGLPQRLVQWLPGDLQNEQHECHNATPPGQWPMRGKVQTVHCTDSGLPRGNIYAIGLDNSSDYQAAQQSFNQWWGFLPQSARPTCPPTTTVYGLTKGSYSGIPAYDRDVQECGTMELGPDKTAPAYALFYPQDMTFVVVEGTPGSSFPALIRWLNSPSALPSPTLTPATPAPTPSPPHAADQALWNLIPGNVQPDNCQPTTPTDLAVEEIYCTDAIYNAGTPGAYLYYYLFANSTTLNASYANNFLDPLSIFSDEGTCGSFTKFSATCETGYNNTNPVINGRLAEYLYKGYNTLTWTEGQQDIMVYMSGVNGSQMLNWWLYPDHWVVTGG